MNARGDMMQKPLDLTDMLLRRADGAAHDRAQSPKAPARKAAPAALPGFAAPASPAEAATRASKAPAAPSFQEHVKESQEKLARNDHAFFKRPGNLAARPGNLAARPGNLAAPQAAQAAKAATARQETREPRARAAEAREEAASRAGADRPEDAGDAREARAAERSERDARPDKARPASARAKAHASEASSQTETAEAQEIDSSWSPKEARPAGLAASPTDPILRSDWEELAAHADLDADALAGRLEELGISATPEQLSDPAFLAEMLWMIDALPMASPLFEGAPAGEAADFAVAEAADTPAALPQQAAPAAGRPGIPADAAARSEAAPSAVPAGDYDWTAVAEPEREEIAALIREKLGGLADMERFRAAPGDADGKSAATTLPAEARFARVAAEALPARAAAAPADLALSDPDRLRVLQGAVLAPATTTEGIGFRPEADFDLESADAEGADPIYAAALSASDEAAGEDGEMPDLLGRQGAQAQPDGAAAGRDAAAPRDAAGPNFHAALDQVRGADAKAPLERPAPLPHQATAHEQTVLAQIGRKLSVLGLRGNEEIRIQLEPEHLGKVRVALDLREGSMTARISVENEAVRQIVDANLASLRESLEAQGVKLQGLEVSVDQRHASLFNPDGSNAREFFQRRGQGGADAAPENPAEDAEADTGRRLGYNTLEFIA